jgi:hypothetical protein
MQRDCYDPPGSLLPIDNPGLEAAWQYAFDAHRSNAQPNGLMVLEHQVDAKGVLQAFAPLFRCQETRQWFHPVCPQCGLALRLCRDDRLLERRGLPTYTGSLERLLYCEPCAGLSDEAPFYRRDTSNRLPDFVQDRHALIARWQQLLATLPDDADLPCRGCAHQDACYGSQSLAIQRVTPFAFYPFYLLMLPAPSCSAAEFIPLISGQSHSVQAHGAADGTPSPPYRFLFRNQDRWFLEILYLKLAFLAQLCDQLLFDNRPMAISPTTLSLDSIGVDLNPGGIGLPAYWSFKARILDMVGSVQTSPFAPTIPESPRLHCLGALWFHTLLVNEGQTADRVFAEVGRLLADVSEENGPDRLNWDLSGADSLFAAEQIMWSPKPIDLPEKWRELWQRTLQLGGRLAHAGVKAGGPWDGDDFRTALEALLESIKKEMFATPAASAETETSRPQFTRLETMLGNILHKWQAPETDTVPPTSDPSISGPMIGGEAAAAVPTETTPAEPSHIDSIVAGDSGPASQQPQATEWDDSIQETVVLSSAASGAEVEPTRPPVSDTDPTGTQAQWNDAIDETVILPGGGAAAPTPPPSAVDESEKTVVISPPSMPSQPPPAEPDADLEATVVQNGSGSSPTAPDDGGGDLEATVILNASGSASATDQPADAADEDLAATLVQGDASTRSTASAMPGDPTQPPPGQWQNGDDLEATVVIKPPAPPSPPISSQGADDDDLEATLIETPRGGNTPAAAQGPPATPDPPRQPDGVQSPSRGDIPDPGNADASAEDDDIMEQTIIIRSDVKKE